MEILNLKNNIEYLEEYLILCHEEWGNKCEEGELKNKIKNKIDNIYSKDSNLISVLGLINKEDLIGFISLLKNDGDKRDDLTPWYGTMYVKEEYRGKGYSKLLNDSILKMAKELGYNKVYLKTSLINYYEKFGAQYIEKIDDKESLYCININ